MSTDSICKMYETWRKDKIFPNYLNIELQKLTDSTYEASIANFQITSGKNCLPSIASRKFMTFRKSGLGLFSKLKKTLYY